MSGAAGTITVVVVTGAAVPVAGAGAGAAAAAAVSAGGAELGRLAVVFCSSKTSTTAVA